MYKDATLNTLNGGSAHDIFNHALSKVIANINDISTPAEEKRQITLTFEFSPTKDRGTSSVLIGVRTKLAEVEKHGGHIFIGHEGNKLRALASASQGNLFDEKAQTQTVDQQTNKPE